MRVSGLCVGNEAQRRVHLHPTPFLSSIRPISSLRLSTHVFKPKQRDKLKRVVFHASTSDDPLVSSPPASIAAAELPTFFERLVAALMFLLPLSEGAYRMALSFVRFCKHQALEFLYWCHYQHRQVSIALAARTVTDISRDDIITLQTLMQMSERLHEWFSSWSAQLASLTRPLQQFRDTALGSGWLSVAVGTPEALWQLGCLLYMSVLAGLAALKLSRLANEKPRTNGLTLFFRRPEVITVSYFCALLMRMSWAPMEGMSDLSLDIYWLLATVLTVITTGCAATQMHTLIFARVPKVAQFLDNMAREVTWLARFHRSFLLLDWLLCLFSSVSFDGKCLRSVLLLVYWKTVSALEEATLSAKRASVK